MTADTPSRQAEQQPTDRSVRDPDVLRDRDDVVVEESTRPIADEKFEALRERYDVIAGVVQIGLTNDDAVLLWGDEGVAPPGGSVQDGEDWVATARDTMESLTGQRVEVEDPLMLEVTHFARESDESETFPASSVHFAASLVDPDPEFLGDPTPPEDFEHPMFEDLPTLQWVDEVTEDVEDNHAHHVELYLD